MAKDPWTLKNLAKGKSSPGPKVTAVGSGSHKPSHPRSKRYFGLSSEGKAISEDKAKSMGITSSQINKIKKEVDRRASTWGFGAKTKTFSTIKSNPQPPLKSAKRKKSK